MDRYNTNAGTTAEVLDELTELRDGREQQGRHDKVALYQGAIDQIVAGADTVRVGSHVWTITDWAEAKAADFWDRHTKLAAADRRARHGDTISPPIGEMRDEPAV